MKIQTIVRSPYELLCPGRVFEWHGDRLEIRSVQNGTCITRQLGGTELKAYPVDLLINELGAQRRSIDLSSVSAKTWEQARAVARECALVVSTNKFSADELAKHAARVGLGLCQFRRYLNRYRDAPFVTSCVACKPGRREGRRLLPERVEQVIIEIRKAELAKEEATSLDQIVRRIKDVCESEQEPVPCKDTVHRRLREAGVSLSKRRQLGPHKYKEATTAIYSANTANRFCDQWQMDHTQMDIMVLDNSRRFVLGRPWLTVVLDIHTRCIMGFYISFLPPSGGSVARALSMAASSKHQFLRSLGLASALTWDMEGIPRILMTDHGSDFKGHAVVRGCQENQIEARLRQVTHSGGHIERLAGTLMSRLHLLRGTTFSNVPRRMKYDPEHRAVFTGLELVRFVTAQVIEYLDTKHRSLNITPRMAWAQSIADKSYELRMPVQPKFFRDFLMRRESVRQKDGFHWGGYVFNSKVLRPFPVGRKFTYRIDLMKTSCIYLESDGDLIEVPRVTAVTFEEHELERQFRLVKAAQCNAEAVVSRREAAIAEQSVTYESAKLQTALAKRQSLAVRAEDGTAVPAGETTNGELLEAREPADLLPVGRVQRPALTFKSSRF